MKLLYVILGCTLVVAACGELKDPNDVAVDADISTGSEICDDQLDNDSDGDFDCDDVDCAQAPFCLGKPSFLEFVDCQQDTDCLTGTCLQRPAGGVCQGCTDGQCPGELLCSIGVPRICERYCVDDAECNLGKECNFENVCALRECSATEPCPFPYICAPSQGGTVGVCSRPFCDEKMCPNGMFCDPEIGLCLELIL